MKKFALLPLAALAFAAACSESSNGLLAPGGGPLFDQSGSVSGVSGAQTAATRNVLVTWNTLSGAVKYNVEIVTACTATDALAGNGNVPQSSASPLPATSSHSLSLPESAASGTYAARVKATGQGKDGAHTDWSCAPFTYTAPSTSQIAQQDVAVTITATPTTYTYNGAPQAFLFATSPSGVATSATYNGSTTAPTNAGTYNVEITVTQAGHTGRLSTTMTIAPLMVTFSAAPTTYTYNGQAQAFQFSASANGVPTAVRYSSGGAPTNAGSYEVTVSATGTNHIGSGRFGMTIERAEAKVNIATAAYTLGQNLCVVGSISGLFGSDQLSGTVSCATSGGAASGAGQVMVAYSGGLSGSNYDVTAGSNGAATVNYVKSDFRQPILANGTRTEFRAGSTVPLKFRLADVNGVSVSNAVATLNIGGGAFRYDATDAQYILNFRTTGMAAGDYTVVANLDSGQKITALIRLTSK